MSRLPLLDLHFTKTEIRRIPMGRAYDSSTKVDRKPAFIRELMNLGEQRAVEFRSQRNKRSRRGSDVDTTGHP